MSTFSWVRRPSRRRALAREVLLATVIAVLAAAGMNHTLLPRLRSALPGLGADPFIELWSLAWSGHALDPRTTASPGALPAGLGGVFDGNAFYPAHDSLAFTDSLLGLGPFSWVLGPAHIVASFGVIFVLSSALSSLAAYLLARQLGAHWIGAAVAAAAFGYPVWRVGQVAHLHVLATGPMVLALALLARGHGLRWRAHDQAGPRPLWVVLGWAAACWQLSIGFAQGLPFAYLLGAIGLVTLLAVPAHAWFFRRPAVLTWPVAVTDVAGAAAFAATGVLMAVPYQRVQDADPAAVALARGTVAVQQYSPPLSGLVTPPSVHGTWSWLTGGATLGSGSNELRLLPGAVLIGLALTGLLISSWRRRWRWTLALVLLGSGALVLGSTLSVGGFSPFLALHDHAPGWASDRTPGRLIAFSTLVLALLAAGAVTAMIQRAGPAGWRLALFAVLPVLVLAEGYGPVPASSVPKVPLAVRQAQGPMVVLPSVWTFDSRVMTWTALRGFPELANGQSGITPGSLTFMRAQLLDFPDARSVAYLRANGFRSVAVLKRDLGTTLWSGATAIPDPALGLTRRNYPDSVLYTLN